MKTRIAPSPTGDPHLGTAFVAVINSLLARHNNGSFVLRIEDTDRARSTPESEMAILNSLKWLGLTWDEGPDVGGANGPYRQSERLEIYDAHIKTLLDAGHAFPCFCSKKDLDAMRAAQKANKMAPRYDGRCAHIDPAVAAERMKTEDHVVRLKMPETGTCRFHDDLRGDISFEWTEMDWFIVRKADGWPTYHLANVVDDHLMGITHVVRGEEWIPSTPKHVWLYHCFGWDTPAWAHLPLLRNIDKSKLSKRKNPVAVTHYKRRGYLPDALRAFLASFAAKTADETDLAAVENDFSLAHLSLGGPVFDLDKLDWLNGQYLRRLDGATFKATVMAWFDEARFDDGLTLAQSRITKLSDLPGAMGYLFSGDLNLSKETLLDGKLDEEALANALATVWIGLEETAWTQDDVSATLRKVAEMEGVAFKALVRHLYIVFTGTPHALPLFESLINLGRGESMARLGAARALLAPVGAKKMDKKRNAWTA